eukprot:3890411-Amphidinium_carterae.1
MAQNHLFSGGNVVQNPYRHPIAVPRYGTCMGMHALFRSATPHAHSKNVLDKAIELHKERMHYKCRILWKRGSKPPGKKSFFAKTRKPCRKVSN